jgi:hypothetical protein
MTLSSTPATSHCPATLTFNYYNRLHNDRINDIVQPHVHITLSSTPVGTYTPATSTMHHPPPATSLGINDVGLEIILRTKEN